MSDRRRTQRRAQGSRIRMSATGVLLAAAAIVGPAADLEAAAGSDPVDRPGWNPRSVQVQAAAEIGSEAPEIILESIDGDSLQLSDLQGEKNVVLVFFRGTW